MKSLLVVALAVAAFCDVSSAFVSRRKVGEGNPIVSTPYGQVEGTIELDTINAFRAIPFAEPPVGNLRFAPTVPLQNGWSGVLDGTQFSSGCMSFCPNTSFPRPVFMCPQTVSEDCLYLNVYTPTLNTSAKLPVMLFIHGGNYMYGAGGVPLYDGSDLAKNENIVVVTTNYRLNIFGALYTGGDILGNYQTQDQRQAMRFVNQIISSFGGDPNRVTISGQSAGAFSVATHLSTPKSWSLFQQAIIISDPLSLPALTIDMALALSNKVLESVGCPLTAGPSQVACLRSLPADTLLNASTIHYLNMSDFVSVMMQWTPVVDGFELPMQPFTALTTGNFNKVPIFVGTTANESVQFIYDITDTPISPIGYVAFMDAVFGLDRGTKAMELYGPIPAQYQTDAHQFLSVAATDFIFYCATRAVARATTTFVPTFVWFFDYLGSWNEWCFGSTMEFCVHNVCHAEDLPFVFNPFAVPVPGQSPPSPSAEDMILITAVQSAYGNFVRTGNPNPLPSGGSFTQYNGMAANMVNFSVPVSNLNGYRTEYCDFWDSTGGYIN
eukprot:GILI01003299.1.p1 GENE.GILI01003299.1~~GILI01003299.1.p1  ORF type:complete len:563 (-),score=176.97 GILI01003299.1:191-1846(-)